MYKKIFIMLLLFSCIFSVKVCANTLNEEYDKQFNMSGADEVLEYLPDEVKDTLSEWGISMEKVDVDMDFQKLLSSIFGYIKSTVVSPASTTVIIIAILFICTIFSSLTVKEEHKEIISFISAVVLCVASIFPISDLLEKSQVGISLCCGLNLMLMPIYSGILLASGSVKSLTTCNIVFFVSQAIELFVTSFFPSMVGIYTSLSISSGLNMINGLSKISQTIKKIIDWFLGISITLFTAILTITGLFSSVSDSVTQRMSKFLVGSSFPIIGGTISDTLGTILGALKCLKSSVALYGIGALVVILLPIVVETLLWRYFLLFSSHLAEMLDQTSGAEMLKAVSNGIGVIFSIIVSSSIIFLVSLSAVVMGGGLG